MLIVTKYIYSNFDNKGNAIIKINTTIKTIIKNNIKHLSIIQIMSLKCEILYKSIYEIYN